MGQEGTPPPQHHQLQAKLLQGFANGGLALSLVVLALERGSSYSLPGQLFSHSRPSGPSICLVSLSPPQMRFHRPGGRWEEPWGWTLVPATAESEGCGHKACSGSEPTLVLNPERV